MVCHQIVGNECVSQSHRAAQRRRRHGQRPPAHNYDIKIIILFPFLFIIRIIILCGVIIGEMFRSDKRSRQNGTQGSLNDSFSGFHGAS